jgi:hypothetical protein
MGGVWTYAEFVGDRKVGAHPFGDALSSILSVDIVKDKSRDLNERLRTAVYSVIDSLQDDISEDLRTTQLRLPWTV